MTQRLLKNKNVPIACTENEKQKKGYKVFSVTKIT